MGGRRWVVVFAAAVAGISSSSAHSAAAQTAGGQKAAAPGDAGGASIAEVVVTAQKRSERIQDVPISIVAVTGSELEKAGVTTSTDLPQLVPGLQFTQVGGYTALSVRGISTDITTAGGDPNVAIYIDGVYQANPIEDSFDLPDVSRIDVSKGPQGTLFGRNATGGAIQIFTRDPSNNFTGRLSFDYGSFHDQIAKAYVAGPIIADKLFGSITGFEETADSYYRNIGPASFKPNGVGSHLYRIKLLYEPTSNLSIKLSGYSAQHGDPSAFWETPYKGLTPASLVPGAVVPSRPRDVAGNLNLKQIANTWGVSGKAVQNTSIGTLTLTASYDYQSEHILESNYNAYVPTGGYYFPAYNPSHNIQLEMDFTSVRYGPFSYISGVNYYSDLQEFDPIEVVNNNVGTFSIYGRQTSHTYSAFGEATYDFTPKLSAILGARYSIEKRVVYGNDYLFGSFTREPPDGWPKQGERTFYSITPRFSLRYKIDPESNIYFTYSEGYKSGLFNAASVPFAGTTNVVPSVHPERLKSYEIGLKSQPVTWASFDVATFLYRYSNQQVEAYQDVDGIPLSTVLNAAASTLYGADVDGTIKPIPDLTLQGGIELLHAQFDRFPDALANVIAPNRAGLITIPIDATGLTPNRAADLTFNLSASYGKTYDFGHLDGTINVYHSGKIYLDQADLWPVNAHTTIGVQIAYSPLNRPNLVLTFYGRNLTDETVITGSFLQGTAAFSYNKPRNFGFLVSYDW